MSPWRILPEALPRLRAERRRPAGTENLGSEGRGCDVSYSATRHLEYVRVKILEEVGGGRVGKNGMGKEDRQKEAGARVKLLQNFSYRRGRSQA